MLNINSMKKQITISLAFVFSLFSATAQTVSLDSIINTIQKNNPSLKMYDADIRSSDEAAKGARNWDAPTVGTGLWMTPYNPKYWKKGDNGAFGMGQYQISAEQMFPNKKRLDAEEKYLQSVSSVDAERKKATLNELVAAAKKNYYEWIIIKKKLSVLDQDEKLLNFMIQSAEIRYKNGLGKINAYYKAKAAIGNIQNMRLMLENEIKQRRIILNTLMSRDKLFPFDVDTMYVVKNYSATAFDSTTFINSRSDIKAIEKSIAVNYLQQSAEKAKLKPEFGVRYEHMFGFGGLPMQYTLLGTVKIPLTKWSSRSAKANVESLKWKTESLYQQKQTIVNEATGMAYGMQNDIEVKKKQIKLFDENIIPALRKNFQTMQLAYEQNTEELFSLFDAWETLNMTQLEYLQQLQDLLMMQVALEKVLEIK
ncbi:MAG: TolC family protein [Sphingobacteriales bacterium]|nr:TolC family protein [Sphingobacteriales bacterium]MBI3717529.1 TolC family protein [Sphingobacteriales bacterium]